MQNTTIIRPTTDSIDDCVDKTTDSIDDCVDKTTDSIDDCFDKKKGGNNHGSGFKFYNLLE